MLVPWLIGSNCAVFGLWGVAPLHDWMLTHFALSLESVRHGRFHTILSNSFSHFAFGHLASNMLMLYVFGRELPRQLGAASFVGLYFGGAVTASSAWLVQQQSLHARSLRRQHSTRASALYHTPSLGASGAVNAVVMCSCLLAPRRTFLLLFVLPMPAGVLAALFLAKDAYGMLQGPESSQIAHSAHLGGALLAAVWVGLRRL